MRVLIYEFVTGGGTFSWPGSPAPASSLLREGTAMIRALAADFLKLPGVEVFALRDWRLSRFNLPGCFVTNVRDAPDESRVMSDLAARCEATIVIAPECGGLLHERSQRVLRAGGRLLSPGLEFIAIAADKAETSRQLAAAGVSVPHGVTIAGDEPLPSDFPYPAVCKPIDGAGSTEVRKVPCADADTPRRRRDARYRLERFYAGLAASVAVLCGPGGRLALPACTQRLSDDGRFHYLGGETPLPEPLAARAQGLALAALAALPETVGYVGIDLVLGNDSGGADDVVIEVNPRLTTSYVGLRAAARGNLAQAMFDVATGRRCVLSFGPERVEFESDGTIKRGSMK